MSVQAETAVVDLAVHEKAIADAKAEAFGEGITAAQTRIGAILGSDEAKGRETQANHIAFKTNMNVEDAVGLLAASAKVEAAPVAAVPAANVDGGFDAAMAEGNPEVGAAAAGVAAKGDNDLDTILALAAQFGIGAKTGA